MKQSIAAFVVAVTLFSTGVGIGAETTSVANQEGLVVIDSANTMAETEKRLIAALEASGLKIAARIDHEANARRASVLILPLRSCLSSAIRRPERC